MRELKPTDSKAGIYTDEPSANHNHNASRTRTLHDGRFHGVC